VEKENGRAFLFQDRIVRSDGGIIFKFKLKKYFGVSPSLGDLESLFVEFKENREL